MKNHLFLLLLLLGGLSLGIQSCNPDSSDDSDPTSKALTGSGLSTNNDSLKIGSVTKISIKAVRGGNPLKTISVKVNGIDLVAGTFNINGSSAFANPVLLFGADRDSLVYAYEFTRIDTPQSLSYEFTITDEADKKTTQTVNIKYYGTPSVESGKGLAVYNYSGTKFGGLDLFNAKVVSGNAPEATIRDYGVVDPVSDKTWVMDPQGVPWETFYTTGSATTYGEDAELQMPAKSACCAPASDMAAVSVGIDCSKDGGRKDGER